MDPIINHVASTAPRRGHRIAFARLDGTRTLDLADLHAAAGRLAAVLASQGLRPGDRLGILAANSLEWVLLDLAALRLKAVTAGFEPGKFEPDDALVAKYGLAMLFTDRPFVPDGAAIHPIAGVAALAEVKSPGAPPTASYEPGDITTVKFTSGSTGEPKGLAATAGSIDSSVSAVQEMFEHTAEDDLFIFLPLSLLQQRYWIYSALYYGHDVTVSTYEVGFAAMGRIRPTVVMGVPAYFETAKKHIESRAARAVEKNGADPDEALRDAARTLFGDRIRYLWTGSAPARASMLSFFTGAGLPIYEGYGLNETCIVAKNHPGAHREGSVGRVLARKKVLFDEDGVISVHSEFPVNTRYEYAAPGDSERIFRPGNVVRTGDVGYVDEDGFLYIRGRYDDVIVLDNGRKVIVRPVEERMKASPAIAECVVYCPAQTHLVAVVSPASAPADGAAIAEHLEKCNAAAEDDERISVLVIADEPFTIENGLLTSQYKPIRPKILETYRERVTAAPGKG